MEQSPSSIDRPALGYVARLGDLYDARCDKFLNVSIFKIPPVAIPIPVDADKTWDSKFLSTESYKEKKSGYGLNAGLTLRMLSGYLGSVDGSAKYLQEEKSETKTNRITYICSATTSIETLPVFNKDLQACISEDALKAAADEESPVFATHVINRIQWGAKFCVTAEDSDKDDGNKHDFNLGIQAEFTKLFSQINANAHFKVKSNANIDSKFKQCSVQVYGDILPKGGSCGWDQVQNLIGNFSELLQETNDGKGKPVFYGLIPISVIQSNLNLQKSSYIWRPISDEIVVSFLMLFDRIQNMKEELLRLIKDLKSYAFCLADEDREQIENIYDVFVKAEQKIKTEIKKALNNNKNHTNELQVFNEILTNYSTQNCEAFKITQDFIVNRDDEIGKKLFLAKTLKAIGIRYLERGQSIETLTLQSGCADRMHVMFVGSAHSYKNPSKLYNDTLRFFVDLAKSSLKSEAGNSDFIFVDCKVHQLFSENTTPATIHYYHKGVLESDNYKQVSIVGKYELVDNGNYGELLTAIGIWGIQWYAIMNSSSTVNITESDGRYNIEIVTTVGTVSHTFRLNEEFGEQTADGKNSKSMVTKEGNKLIHLQNVTNSEKSDTLRITERVFTSSEMKVNLTLKGIKATRVYKKIK